MSTDSRKRSSMASHRPVPVAATRAPTRRSLLEYGLRTPTAPQKKAVVVIDI
ncbi:hypothetical protein [Rhodococcoides fascians]|uniref:hypothetical protein n=1 Tax=Rhodococcoides fascians TaxID=1828 RepID=UPI001A93CC7F|nr:hypothetical protein [Rhodococcus fascians]